MSSSTIHWTNRPVN